MKYVAWALSLMVGFLDRSGLRPSRCSWDFIAVFPFFFLFFLAVI